MQVPTLNTERLRIRAFELEDVSSLHRLIGVREVAANLLRVPHPYTEQDARSFINSSRESPEARFAVVLRSEDILIGGIGLDINPSHPRAELGYWLGVPYWGQGYATEAANAVLEYGFQTLGFRLSSQPAFRQGTAQDWYEAGGLPASACAEVGPIYRSGDVRNPARRIRTKEIECTKSEHVTQITFACCHQT
jgi:Acetyltransferase (GNAT) domain